MLHKLSADLPKQSKTRIHYERGTLNQHSDTATMQARAACSWLPSTLVALSSWFEVDRTHVQCTVLAVFAAASVSTV